MKKLSREKLDNPIYSKVKFNLTIEATHEEVATNQKINKLLISQDIKNNKKLSYMKPLDRNCLHKSLSSLNCSIQNSTPYVDQYEESKKIKAINKKKWISKENFNACFDKATISKNSIVDLLDVGPSHNCFELRKDNKNKWITKKNFFV